MHSFLPVYEIKYGNITKKSLKTATEWLRIKLEIWNTCYHFYGVKKWGSKQCMCPPDFKVGGAPQPPLPMLLLCDIYQRAQTIRTLQNTRKRCELSVCKNYKII